MTPILTYLDSDVLISATRIADRHFEASLELLAEPARRFAASIYTRLEVIPKPAFNSRPEQVEFFEDYFAAIAKFAHSSPELSIRAEIRARRLGLSALDALHLEAAVSLRCDQFITAERKTSPIFRETEIAVVGLGDYAE